MWGSELLQSKYYLDDRLWISDTLELFMSYARLVELYKKLVFF